MKVYYSQKENHFIGGGLGQLQNNNLYVSNHVIELLVQQENNIMWLNNGEDFVVQKLSRVGEFPHFQDYKITYTALNVSIKVDTKIKEFSRFIHKQTDTGKNVLTFPLVREDFIRPYYSPSLYIYVKIPWKFLRENLALNLGRADVQKYYRFMKGVDCGSYKAILDRIDEGDKLYPALLMPTGKKAYPQWRASIFTSTQHSAYKYGFAYPLLNHNSSGIFFDGTHRLTLCPVIEKDYPVLINLNYQLLKEKKPIYFISPPLFKNNSSVILSVNPVTKEVGGWIRPVEDTKHYSNSAKWNWNFPTHLTGDAFNHVEKTYLEQGFDFVFKDK